MIARLTHFAATLRNLAEKRRRWRLPLLILGLAIFLGGCIWSVARLDIAAEDIRWHSMALLALVLAPLGLVYAAANMMVTAKATQIPMSFGEAFRIASLAQTAEVLPLPGGALVRTAALIQRGASATSSTSQVLANAIMWIGCSATAAGWMLLSYGPIPSLLTMGGMIAVLASAGWIGRKAGLAVAAASFGLRLIGLALVAVRISVAFAALGFVADLAESFLFAFATIAGSASSIAPAGLGVSESLAALFSQAVSVAPAAAFICVGINRIAGLSCSAIASAILLIGQKAAK